MSKGILSCQSQLFVTNNGGAGSIVLYKCSLIDREFFNNEYNGNVKKLLLYDLQLWYILIDVICNTTTPISAKLIF